MAASTADAQKMLDAAKRTGETLVDTKTVSRGAFQMQTR